MEHFIYKWQIFIILKSNLHMISSIVSLWEFLMFLFSYYKPNYNRTTATQANLVIIRNHLY
jgi:hypothetical protein